MTHLHGGSVLKRIMLRVSYDGTNYHGWQLQPGVITVEGVLNEAVSKLIGEQIQVIGASRTDAGVHALGNVAVFDTCSCIPAEKFSYALNQRLPEDIVIQESVEVLPDFHPRHCECQKTYEYTIINRKFPLPEYRNTSFFYYGKLDVGRMRLAAEAFIGEHDFAAFCSAGAQVKTTVRHIYGLEILEEPGESRIRIRVTGNGFLYNMVRIIAGTLIRVGRGFYTPERIKNILEAKERTADGVTAPPNGLVLVGIDYGKTDLF